MAISNWELISSEIDRKYNIFSISINRSKSPSTGQVHEFQVIDSPDWVAVIAITDQQEIVLVRQFRHGISQVSLEPPGGLVKPDTTPLESGKAELAEETGYTSEDFQLLGWMYPVPAIFKNKFYVYLAQGAKLTSTQNLDETEEIEILLLPVKDIPESIRSGQINCSVMIAALHLYLDREKNINLP